jgi:hypothetical protein
MKHTKTTAIVLLPVILRYHFDLSTVLAFLLFLLSLLKQALYFHRYHSWELGRRFLAGLGVYDDDVMPWVNVYMTRLRGGTDVLGTR